VTAQCGRVRSRRQKVIPDCMVYDAGREELLSSELPGIRDIPGPANQQKDAQSAAAR